MTASNLLICQFNCVFCCRESSVYSHQPVLVVAVMAQHQLFTTIGYSTSVADSYLGYNDLILFFVFTCHKFKSTLLRITSIHSGNRKYFNQQCTIMEISLVFILYAALKLRKQYKTDLVKLSKDITGIYFLFLLLL